MSTHQLTFKPQREYDVIEYPGKVVNTDRMLATLGGITNISKVLGEEKKRLELRYHPDNPYNKPVYGDSTDHTGVVLEITKRVYKNKKNRPPQYIVRVLGHARHVYNFQTLCDFQYLPLWSTPKSDDANAVAKLTCALDDLQPRDVTDVDYFKRTHKELLFLPELFSRVDIPYGRSYCVDSMENGQHEVLGIRAKVNYEFRDMVNFNMHDSLPTQPDPAIVKRMKVKYVSDEQFARVEQLFEECPIWPSIALLYESGITRERLKCIIPSIAFYFHNGPWRSLYVRYGYDPRKDFKSRYYQIFDFRLRFNSGGAEFVDIRKLSKQKKTAGKGGTNTKSDNLVLDVDYPYYEEHKLPRSRQCRLRFCDVHLPKVQEMMEKLPTPLTGAVCNERNGWLPPNFATQVRQIVCASITEVLKNHYRKEQLTAEVDALPQADADADAEADANDIIDEDEEVELDDYEEDAEEMMDVDVDESQVTENFMDKNIEQLLSNM